MRGNFSDRSAISTVIFAVIVIIILVVAIAGFALMQPTESTSTQIATKAETSSSSTEQNTTETNLISSVRSSLSSSTSSGPSGQILMEFTFPGTLLASSDLSSMNYTINFTPVGSVPTNLSLSVNAPSGLSASISPVAINLDLASQATLQVSVPQGTAPGNYRVTLVANGEGSTYKENETVDVVKYLIVTIAATFVPQNLTVVQGNAVTWVRLNGALSQYDNGAHDVDFSSGISVVSPTLAQFNSWSYTFTQTGNYSYYCKYHPFMTGNIYVVPSS